MPGPLDNLEEAIRELQDLYDDPDIVTTADKIQQPDPREDVKTIDAINAFIQRNPKADGGTIGGGNIQGQQIGNRTGFAGPQLIKTGEDKGKYKVRYRDEKFGKRKGAKGYKEGNEIFDTLEEAEKFSKERKDPSKKATGLISKKTEHANKVNQAVNNFIDNNIDRYGVEDFERFKKDLNQYVKTLKIQDLPGDTRKTFYKDFPNIGNIKSEASFQKFNLEPMSTETMGGVREPYFRKLFYKSKLETDLDLKKRMKDYFDYIIINKNTDRAASKRYKNVLQNMSDIQYVLSDQSGIRGKAMSDVLRKTFGNYDDYLKKTNISSERYAKNIAAIESVLSESDLKEVLNGETSIKRFMEKEGDKLKSIFDVSELDAGLRYSMDHTELMSRIANMEDPADIKRALGNLIGMTKARNYELGFGGYASMVKNLTNKIDKGFDVEGNLIKLNKITKKAYPELKNKKAYEIIDNKLVPTKFFSFQTTPEDRFRQYFTQLDKTKKGSAVIKKQYGNLENLLATLSNNPACGVFGGKRLNRFTGGGTPDINNCIQGGIDVINSGKIPANKSKEFTQVLKGAGTAGRNLIKFGVIPEALYVGADSLVRLGLGDSFKEAGLRASEYLLPGDQTKIAEISKVERTLGPEAAKIVGRSIDYKNQLQKIESLKKEKQSAETLSPTSEFDYLPSRTEDIKNINTRIKQAESDLQNKFMMPEAERLYAERAQEEAYDISKAKSPFAKIKKFASEIEQPKDDPFLSDVTAPEKSQMELNLDMFPNFKNYLKSEQGFKDKFFLNVPDETLLDLGGEKAVNYKRQLEDAYKMENLKNTFGAEQIYGTQGTFGGQPLQKGGRAGYYDGELVEPVEIDQTGYVEKSKQDMHKHYKYYRQMGGKMGKRQFANEFFRQYHSSGGIASGPPPESGPNSQGLQGLLNRAKKLKE